MRSIICKSLRESELQGDDAKKDASFVPLLARGRMVSQRAKNGSVLNKVHSGPKLHALLCLLRPSVKIRSPFCILRLNEAVKRNRERFPKDFLFQLSSEERDALTSQIAISKTGRGGRRTLPYAFTEHDALQAANVLKSPRAIQMSVFVIRAFVKMREELAANAAILKRLAEIEKDLLIHDTALRDIYEKLRPLLAPPPQPPKPEIGFHIKEDAIPYRVRRRPVRL